MERTPVSFGPGVFLFYGGTMADKVFKTHDELIALLISRGIDISTPEHKSFAKKALQHKGYYNLINGYSKLFILSTIPDDRYKPGTTVEEICALYDFDRALRNIFFKYILSFETSKKEANKNITSVIADFQKQISSRAADPSIEHYLKKYGYVPLWVLNNILTLGQISKFYSILRQPDRQQISKIFHITDNQLESILFYLSAVRNFSAHGNRLYCFRTKRPLADFEAHSAMQLTKTYGKEYDVGKRDLFAAMIALHYVLSTADYKKMIKEIYRQFSYFRARMNVLREEDILREMGFPIDWRKRLLNLK